MILFICLLVSLSLECEFHEGKGYLPLIQHHSRHLEESWFITCSLNEYLLEVTYKMGCCKD